jgi:hypothetical protein
VLRRAAAPGDSVRELKRCRGGAAREAAGGSACVERRGLGRRLALAASVQAGTGAWT